MYVLTEDALKVRLAGRGLRVPQGEVVSTPQGAAEVTTRVGPPVMIKALLAMKDRARHGFVRRCGSASEARAVSEDLLGLATDVGPVERLLVESVAPPGEEFYLAVGVDYLAAEPIILVGNGGSGIEHLATRPARVRASVDGSFDKKSVPEPLRPVAEALLAELLDSRAQFIELNPVRVCEQGPIVLDGKATLDAAVALPPDAVSADHVDEIGEILRREADSLAGGTEVRFGLLGGDIGVVSAGGGVLSIVNDALRRHGLAPANFADVSGGTATARLLGSVAREVARLDVRGIVIATGITSSVSVTELAQYMVENLSVLNVCRDGPPIVARMAGVGEEDAAHQMSTLARCTTVGKDVTVEECVAILAERLVGA